VTRAVIPWRDHLESLNLLLSAIAIDFPSLCLTVPLWIRKPSMVQRKSKGDDFFWFWTTNGRGEARGLAILIAVVCSLFNKTTIN